MKCRSDIYTSACVAAVALVLLAACTSKPSGDTSPATGASEKYYEHHLVFPYQDEHVHGSAIVELPNGDLLTAWFQGSGERWGTMYASWAHVW